MFEEELKYFKLAKELNKKHHTSLLENQLHFRGNLKSFSIVSVSQKSPECGKSGLISKEQAEKHLNVSPKHWLKNPGRKTEEKNLQAFIINHSLNNNGILPFGDFEFVTSEMVLKLSNGKKIINDILAIDSDNKLAIIELKSIRNNKVKQQAIEFEKKVRLDTTPLIKELVKIITGKTWNGNIRKIAVWQAPKSQRPILSNNLLDEVELYNYVFDGERTNEYVIMDKVTFAKE
ncbi:hypothetical protein SAMN05421813_13238 [Daejeonella rubra]|uniref:Uncharacterized protein n=1 Tax=Daejeonella rubra TaxID=990371 RepID=A0A1G9XU31_9SPHI|nr:hypothetical protein [Daejeonella rubra]SDN00332.1 hypothetical protein SAMN05421813_13238 [Daejeonella rubra]